MPPLPDETPDARYMRMTREACAREVAPVRHDEGSQDPYDPTATPALRDAERARVRCEVARLTRELNYYIEAAVLGTGHDVSIIVSQHPLGRSAPSLSVRLTDRPVAWSART